MLAADRSAWSLKLTVRDGIGSDAVRLAEGRGVSGARPGVAGCRAFLLTLTAREGVGAGPPLASVRSLGITNMHQQSGHYAWIRVERMSDHMWLQQMQQARTQCR